MTERDNEEYFRVLLDSYYTTITGWGVLLRYPLEVVDRAEGIGVQGLGYWGLGLGYWGLGFRV